MKTTFQFPFHIILPLLFCCMDFSSPFVFQDARLISKDIHQQQAIFHIIEKVKEKKQTATRECRLQNAHISLDQSISSPMKRGKDESINLTVFDKEQEEEEMETMKRKLWRSRLSEETLPVASDDSSPFPLFTTWLEEAIHSGCLEPNATTLATVNHETGRVSSRIILLKDVSETNGFIWYTNYNSQKGKDLAGLKNSKTDITSRKSQNQLKQNVQLDEERNFASLTFWWPELERQVRVEGQVYKLSEEENEKNFRSRPRKFQEAVWASDQSLPISNRFALDTQMRSVQAKFKEDSMIPKPSHWGGYRLVADRIEFWKGRRDENNIPLPSDRFEYWKSGDSRETDVEKNNKTEYRASKGNEVKNPFCSRWHRRRLQP